MERAEGRSALADRARRGRDVEASRIICAAVVHLHARERPPHDLVKNLVPLTRWFAALKPAADMHGGILRRCATTAAELLAAPRDETVLHGDIHHDNVFDFGPSGWLVIDPKGLIGERLRLRQPVLQSRHRDGDIARPPGAAVGGRCPGRGP
jgi:streptomycin 6-kinase